MFRAFRIDSFNPGASFSDATPLNMTSLKWEDGERFLITFPTLFNMEYSGPDAPDKKKLENFISHQHKKVKLPKSSECTENELLISISRQILVPLFGRILFKEQFSGLLEPKDKEHMYAEVIGMGTERTWHGTPDILIRQNICVVTTSENLANAYDQLNTAFSDIMSPVSSPVSEFSSVSGERKKVIGTRNLDQLVATGITASFVVNNLQPGQNPMVPSLLINSSGFIICLYDCVEDILLISEAILLFDRYELVRLLSIEVLWAVVHHRYYLRRLKEVGLDLSNLKCEFIEQLTEKRLSDFRALNSMNTDPSAIQYPLVDKDWKMVHMTDKEKATMCNQLKKMRNQLKKL